MQASQERSMREGLEWCLGVALERLVKADPEEVPGLELVIRTLKMQIKDLSR